MNKSWYRSKGVWGGILAGIVGVLGLIGLAVPADFVEVVSDKIVVCIEAGIALVGGALAIYGRVKAVEKIGKQ